MLYILYWNITNIKYNTGIYLNICVLLKIYFSMECFDLFLSLQYMSLMLFRCVNSIMK